MGPGSGPFHLMTDNSNSSTSPEEIEFQQPFSPTSSTSESNNVTSRIQAGLAPLNFRASRRGSVSAESYQPHRRPSTLSNNSQLSNNNNDNDNDNDNANDNNQNINVIVSENARNAVKNNFLFRSLDQEQLKLVFSGMRERPVPFAGEIIIRQGEEGDNFYIVEAGKYGVEVDGQEVVQIGPGGSFGELALMYNAPRAATVKALEDGGLLYAVDRQTFRRVIIDLAHEKRCKYMDFLKSLPLLANTLSDLEIGKIADALEEVNFCEKGSLVIRQGDPGDAFYIITEGKAEVEKDGILVAGDLGPGAYFGELALLKRQPRAATIRVKEAPLKCLRLGEADFVRLLGPLEEILKRNEDQYNQYKHIL